MRKCFQLFDLCTFAGWTVGMWRGEISERLLALRNGWCGRESEMGLHCLFCITSRWVIWVIFHWRFEFFLLIVTLYEHASVTLKWVVFLFRVCGLSHGKVVSCRFLHVHAFARVRKVIWAFVDANVSYRLSFHRWTESYLRQEHDPVMAVWISETLFLWPIHSSTEYRMRVLRFRSNRLEEIEEGFVRFMLWCFYYASEC